MISKKKFSSKSFYILISKHGHTICPVERHLSHSSTTSYVAVPVTPLTPWARESNKRKITHPCPNT